jgi:hypothetical protein
MEEGRMRAGSVGVGAGDDARGRNLPALSTRTLNAVLSAAEDTEGKMKGLFWW